MTSFVEGPAKGQHLMLKRAAQFIRVVEEAGKWDALDQPEDTPKPTEKIYAYQVHGEVNTCHIRASGGRGGFYPIANYRVVAEQPDDATMRHDGLWTAWCKEKSTL